MHEAQSKKYRIAQVGTFDLKNYGDILFPDILSTELSKYLAIDEIVLFSPIGGVKPFDNRKVLPIHSMEKEHLQKPFDAIICGGGDIIRLDSQVVSNTTKYRMKSTSADLWAIPIFLGYQYHIPVLLNAPGVPFHFMDIEKAFVRTLFESADYISVRDSASNELLRECQIGNASVVPDSIFLVEQTYSPKTLDEIFQALNEELKLPERFFIFQLNELEDGVSYAEYQHYLRTLEDWTSARCVMMPIGYVHNDRETLEKLNSNMDEHFHFIDRELSPKEMLAVIRNSQGFIGTSMHGCLTALVSGRCAIAINVGRITKIAGLFGLVQLSECDMGSIRELKNELVNKQLSENRKAEITNAVNAHMKAMAKIIYSGRKTDEQESFLKRIMKYTLRDTKEYSSLSILYFDYGQGFNAKNSQVFPFGDNGNIQIQIRVPSCTKRIRFDPVEGVHSIVTDLKVLNGTNDITDSVWNNGDYSSDQFFFETNDPQIIFDVEGNDIVNIQCNITPIISTKDKQYLTLLKEKRMFDELSREMNNEKQQNEHLANYIKELEAEKEELKRQNSLLASDSDQQKQQIEYLTNAYKELEAEKEELKRQNSLLASDSDQQKQQIEYLTNAYNVISTSDMWRMSKPIRRMLDCIKGLAMKSQFGVLLLKGLKRLKQEGISSTFKATKAYLQDSKPAMSTLSKNLPEGRFEENQDFSSFKTDIKVLALYLPQFHEIEENNKWWGKGFTEWTNVKKGISRYDGHNQPRVPIKPFGYYDLSDVKILKRQVNLAKQHGIYGFAMYYYWFSGHRLLEKPMDMLLEHKEIDFPFMAVWANENWTRTWDGKESSVLIEQKYTDEDAENFILDLKKYIDDDRYIRVDGKPVVGLYAPTAIPNVKEVLQTWRETALTCGIGEILIWVCSGDSNASIMGIDDYVNGEYEFPPRGKGFVPHCPARDDGTVYNYMALVESARNTEIGDRKIPYFRGSMMEWDNSARKKKNYHCWLGFSPERFYIWNRINVKYLREAYDPEYRFLFVNAWNEWGEGTYLEPDQKLGYACINALSKAIMDLPYEDDHDCNGEEKSSKEQKKYLGCGLGENKEHDWENDLKSNCRIAIQAHVFYPELTQEILQYLSNLPYQYDLFISTTDEKKEQEISSYLSKWCKARKWQVYVHENKGRDVVPFLYQLKNVIYDYKYFCHIHTKKSLHTSNLGDVWRTYLYQNLLGSTETLREIFYEFETNENIGVVFPENMDVVRPFVEWGSNREIAQNLAKRMQLDICFPDEIMFPAGNMFWAKTDAVHNIFDVDYEESDFPDEEAQVDGTLMHAIERSWLYVAQANGYDYQIIRNLSDNRPFDTL